MSAVWFDRFTDRARKVMGFARQASDRFHHDHIGTEHILLGLIEDRTSIAANVLENLDVHLDKLRVEAEKAAGRGDAEDTAQKPFTERAREILDGAMEEARGMGHKYVGTEHLLLGLLRAEGSKVAEVLTGLGVDPEAVRREVCELLGADPVLDKFTVSLSGEPSIAKMMDQVADWHAQAEVSGDVTLAARLRYLLDYLRERILKEKTEDQEGSAGPAG